MNEIYLSVVIPAYNEGKRLPKTLRIISNFLKKEQYTWEIIVVNDGSTDNTQQTLLNFQNNIKILKNEKNFGKGYSSKKGILNAKGKHILLSDADLSTPIKEVNKLLKFLENSYDIAIGSRALKDSDIKIHQPFYRELMGKMFNKIIKILLFKDFLDTQCGFKLFKKGPAYEIFKRQKLDGFAFDVEIIYIAKKLGYKIKEVPITWLNSPNSRVGILRDSIKMFMDVLRIKKLHSQDLEEIKKI